MSCRNAKAVVFWTKERKVGIEPLKSVPETARFVGSVGPVQFSGDGRWYPCKVLFISDDESALNAKLHEVENEIQKENEKLSKDSKRSKSNKRSQPSGAASEREIASALGNRPPVPVELKRAKVASAKSKKAHAKSHSTGQNRLDKGVSDVVKELFKGVTSNTSETNDSGPNEVDNFLSCPTSPGDNCDDQLSDTDSESENRTEGSCSCLVSQFVNKHCNPRTLDLLRDLTFLMENNGNLQESKYLTLREIPDKVKKVELVHGKGIYMAASDKDSLKVDFRNKVSSLIRETLYCLYGKSTFQSFHVTARGQKAGSYGIEESVLKALHVLVNHNVDVDKRVTFSAMVASINKRAPEWRMKATPCTKKKKVDRRRPSENSTPASDGSGPDLCGSPVLSTPLPACASPQDPRPPTAPAHAPAPAWQHTNQWAEWQQQQRSSWDAWQCWQQQQQQQQKLQPDPLYHSL